MVSHGDGQPLFTLSDLQLFSVLVFAASDFADSIEPGANLSILSRVTPFFKMPSLVAAPCDRSRLRPGTNGPRSLIRTRTERPFSGFDTSTTDPNGNVLDAAVSRLGL